MIKNKKRERGGKLTTHRIIPLVVRCYPPLHLMRRSKRPAEKFMVVFVALFVVVVVVVVVSCKK